MDVKHLSTPTYVVVWLALMALTLLSYLLSIAHLGPADTAAALAIATVKTALVLGFFMHLVEQRVANGLAFLAAVLLAILLVSLMVSDVTARQTFPRTPLPVDPAG